MTKENGILVWREQEDWNKTIRLLLAELAQPLRKAIEENPIEYFYYDAQWCEEQGIQLRDGKELPGFQEILAGITQTYPKIRLFHACRTDDIDSYLINGLLPLATDRQIQKAREIFLSDRSPLVKEEDINLVAQDLANEHRGGKIYLSLDDRILIEHDRFYLNYGCEYLAVIASRLPGIEPKDCLEYLRTIGRPTIIVCDIPINWIEKQRMFNLVEDMVEWTIKYPYSPDDDQTQLSRSYTFNVVIPPEFITTYYHPM